MEEMCLLVCVCVCVWVWCVLACVCVCGVVCVCVCVGVCRVELPGCDIAETTGAVPCYSYSIAQSGAFS